MPQVDPNTAAGDDVPAAVPPPPIPMTNDGLDEAWSTVLHIFNQLSAGKRRDNAPYIYPLGEWFVRLRSELFPSAAAAVQTDREEGRPEGP